MGLPVGDYGMRNLCSSEHLLCGIDFHGESETNSFC